MAEPMKILALDDSLTIRKLIERVLTRDGVELELAASGEEGLAKIRGCVPDLILLDYILPDMKGTEICERLQQEEAYQDVSVVVMSAKGESVVSMFEPYQSVSGYLHKPFSPGKIASLVREYLRKKGDPGRQEPASQERPAASPAASPEMPPAPKVPTSEAAAKAIYSQLKEGFNRIPEWFPQLGVQPPALFFAKRLLTPKVVEGVVRSLEKVAGQGSPEESESADLSGLEALLGNQVLIRTDGFAQRILGISLTEGDRLVLAMIDGRSSLQHIVEKSGLGWTEVTRIIANSLQRGLIHKSEAGGPDGAGGRPWWRRTLASKPG